MKKVYFIHGIWHQPPSHHPHPSSICMCKHMHACTYTHTNKQTIHNNNTTTRKQIHTRFPYECFHLKKAKPNTIFQMFTFCVLVQAEEVSVRSCTRKEAVRVCGRPQHASQGKVRRSATHRNPPPVGRPQVLVWQVSDGDKIVTCWCCVSCHCQPHVESGHVVPHPSLHTCLSFWCSHMPWVPPHPHSPIFMHWIPVHLDYGWVLVHSSDNCLSLFMNPALFIESLVASDWGCELCGHRMIS